MLVLLCRDAAVLARGRRERGAPGASLDVTMRAGAGWQLFLSKACEIFMMIMERRGLMHATSAHPSHGPLLQVVEALGATLLSVAVR